MSEGNYVQASPKTPYGTLLNFKADTAAGVKAQLDEAHNVDLFAAVIGAEQTILALHNVETGGLTGQPAAAAPATHASVTPLDQLRSQAATPQTAAPAPAAGPAPQCIHGVKTLLTKPSKQGPPGKTWTAWACPADQHDATKCQLDFNVPSHLKPASSQ